MSQTFRTTLGMVVAGVFCFAAMYGVSRYWYQPSEQGPALEVVSSIRWERVEVMGTAYADVEFRNSGTDWLVIDSIRSGCDCSGLQTTVKGDVVKIEEMRIAPGESKFAQVKFQARGPAGSALSQVIAYRTNEAIPENRERTLVLDIGFVGGGLTGLPTQIDFGVLKPGEVSERKFEIVDDSGAERHVVGVLSCHDSFAITEADHAKVALPGGGHSVVRGKIKFSSKVPGSYHGKIIFAPSDRGSNPEPILMNAKVLPNLRITPDVCVLDDSESQRTATYPFTIESNVGDISEVEAVGLPEYLDCKIDPAPSASGRASLTLALNSRLSKSTLRKLETITFRCRINGMNYTVTTSVKLLG